MADVFCEEEVEDFVTLDCGLELGGIIAIGLIHSTEDPSVEDLQDEDFWIEKIGDSPQRYWRIINTRGSYPGGTPQEEEGYGRNSIRRVGADHEATIEVEGVRQNRDFMNKVNKRKSWHAVIITASNIMLYVRDTSVFAKIVVDQNTKTAMRWNLSVKWSSMDLPIVLDAPGDFFEAEAA